MKNKTFLGLFLLILMLMSAAAAGAADSYSFELSEGYSFSEENEHWSIEISMPKVSGMADKEEQEALNEYILSKKDKMLEEYRELTASAEQSIKDGSDPHFSYQYSWNAVTDNDDYFVFRIEWFFASASAATLSEYFNLDKKTGRLLDFDEDAVTTPEEMAYIREEILAQMEAANEESRREYGAGLFRTEDGSLDNALGQAGNRNHWYYNGDNDLVITFDKYEIAPGVMGSPEFVIPHMSPAAG